MLLPAIIAIMLAELLLVVQAIPVKAETAKGPSLVISQIKLTSSNGQFITLYNTTDSALDMSKYQLEYFNSYDLGKATSSRLIALTGTVPPHGYYMVNDSALLLCYQLTIDSTSLGLSTTAGMIQVLAFNQATPGSAVMPVLQDYMAWSKTAVSSAQTLPTSNTAHLQRMPVDAINRPLVTSPGSGSWQSVQPDSTNPCKLVTTTLTPNEVLTGLSQLLPASEAPATILMVSADTGDLVAAPSLPASDIGLKAPQITEILANPLGTGNDDTDEFIELHNSNPGAFDLTGFSLQVGLTTLRTYKFPAGTMLPGHSFTTFSSADTGLSLSNTGSQVKLLDPFGSSISASQAYGTAKDGQAWALAKGSWYWTLRVTPGAANIVELPPAKKTATKKSTTKKVTSAKVVPAAAGKKPAATSLAGNVTQAVNSSPIHPKILALIVGLALLYGTYEYRADLANRIFQLRSYIKTRFRSRQSD